MSTSGVERAYISVITSAPQQVSAYLYSTAQEILRMQGHPGVAIDRTGLVVAVEALPGNSLATAEYQAGRLNSGLHGARVHETFQEASSHLLSHLVAGKHTQPALRPAQQVYGASPVQQNTRTR